MVETLSPTQQRFYDFLPDRPWWGETKEIHRISAKEDIILKANYIQLPTQKRKYVTLDLDYETAATAWEDEGLLEPTINIINPCNGHAHYLYEIVNPVLLPLPNSKIKTSYKAINYFRAVQAGYVNKLEADKGYRGFSVKNPFSTNWITLWSDNAYDLNYLAEFVDLPNLNQARLNDCDLTLGRHMMMFNECRLKCYKIVHQFREYEDFSEAVNSICKDFYYENIIGIPSDHEFPLSEAMSIARSISKWTWNKRLDKQFKNFMKNRGVMKLSTGCSSVHKLNQDEIKSREVLGAKYTHEQRREKTLKLLTDAADNLRMTGQDVNVKNLVEATGLSKATVYRYIGLIN